MLRAHAPRESDASIAPRSPARRRASCGTGWPSRRSPADVRLRGVFLFPVAFCCIRRIPLVRAASPLQRSGCASPRRSVQTATPKQRRCNGNATICNRAFRWSAGGRSGDTRNRVSREASPAQRANVAAQITNEDEQDRVNQQGCGGVVIRRLGRLTTRKCAGILALAVATRDC